MEYKKRQEEQEERIEIKNRQDYERELERIKQNDLLRKQQEQSYKDKKSIDDKKKYSSDILIEFINSTIIQEEQKIYDKVDEIILNVQNDITLFTNQTRIDEYEELNETLSNTITTQIEYVKNISDTLTPTEVYAYINDQIIALKVEAENVLPGKEFNVRKKVNDKLIDVKEDLQDYYKNEIELVKTSINNSYNEKVDNEIIRIINFEDNSNYKMIIEKDLQDTKKSKNPSKDLLLSEVNYKIQSDTEREMTKLINNIKSEQNDVSKAKIDEFITFYSDFISTQLTELKGEHQISDGGVCLDIFPEQCVSNKCMKHNSIETNYYCCPNGDLTSNSLYCLKRDDGNLGDDGEKCEYDEQCVTDAICLSNTCSNLKDGGETCSSDSICKSGVCYEGVCAPVDGVHLNNGDTCKLDEWCSSGWCNNDIEQCQAKIIDGQSCPNESNDDIQCVSNECSIHDNTSGYYCCPNGEYFTYNGVKYCKFDTNGNLTTTGNDCYLNEQCSTGWCNSEICTAKKVGGETCSADIECESGNCYENMCAPQTLNSIENGTSCKLDEWCSSGWCNNDIEQCQAKIIDGQSCPNESNDDIQCVSNECSIHDNTSGYYCCPNGEYFTYNGVKYCKFDTNGNLTTTGNDCYLNEQCSTGWCNSEICTAKKVGGETCSADIECESGNCYENMCAPQTLNSIVNGASCKLDEWCSSGFCYNDECSDKFSNFSNCTSSNQCESNKCLRFEPNGNTFCCDTYDTGTINGIATEYCLFKQNGERPGENDFCFLSDYSDNCDFNGFVCSEILCGGSPANICVNPEVEMCYDDTTVYPVCGEVCPIDDGLGGGGLEEGL